MANKKYKLTDGNMWATDGIHDFGQNKTQRTINSEVNSALGGKAPTNHASTATTYGAASTSNYGHVKLSNTTPSMDGTAAVGDSTDVARANHVHPSDTSRVPTSRKVNNKQLSSDITLAASDVGAAPTDHASTATTYGKGTSSNYGHVKISDSLTDTTTAATGGVVPSMKAVSDLNGAIKDINPEKTRHSFSGINEALYASNEIYCSDFAPDNTNLLPSGKTEQGFAIYHDLIFQMCDNDYCIIKTLNGENLNGFAITCGHGNSAVFSNKFYNAADEFPLLYVSDITGDVYVNRVTRTGATLIETLYFDPANYGACPQFALCEADASKNLCYVVGGNNMTSPYYPITAAIISICDLDNTTIVNNKTVPTVYDTFTINLTGDYVVLQGVKYRNGRLFLASGGYATSVKSLISIIDPNSKTLVNTITGFNQTITDHELEDIDFLYNPVINTVDMICFVREYGYYKLQFPVAKRTVNPPNIYSGTKIADPDDFTGGITRLRLLHDGWYQVRGINRDISGSPEAQICNYDGSQIYAINYGPEGTFKRAVTPWVYLSKNTANAWICFRVWATYEADSGLYYAPEYDFK